MATLIKEFATKRGVKFTEQTGGDFGWMRKERPWAGAQSGGNREGVRGWDKRPHKGWAHFFSPINVLEPATLKALAERSRSAFGANSRYRAIPIGEVWKASPSFRV